MKSLRTILAIGLVAILSSCETTKQPTASREPGTRGRVNTEASGTANQTTTSRQQAARKTASAQASTNSAAINEAKMREMFTAVNMSQEQINRFQTEWRTSSNAWKRNNRDQEMNNYERVELQDKILRDILDESQFKAYQQWAIDHSAGN